MNKYELNCLDKLIVIDLNQSTSMTNITPKQFENSDIIRRQMVNLTVISETTLINGKDITEISNTAPEKIV